MPGHILDCDVVGNHVTLEALREAHEEIGLPPDEVELVGALQPTPTFVTNYAIYPFVGLIEAGFALEVADAPMLHAGLNLADMAHVLALRDQRVIPAGAAGRLLGLLLEVSGWPAERFPYDPRYGDVLALDAARMGMAHVHVKLARLMLEAHKAPRAAREAARAIVLNPSDRRAYRLLISALARGRGQRSHQAG